MQQRSQQRTQSRRLSRLAGLLCLILAMLSAVGSTIGVAPTPAAAQETEPDLTAPPGLEPCPTDLNNIAVSDSSVRIAKVSGLIDPVVKSFILEELDVAEADGSLALVLWMNSKGSVLDNADFIELATRLRDADVTIAIWVGQSGSSALGGSAELLGVADLVAVTPRSKIGDTGPARLPDEFPPAFGDLTRKLETNTMGPQEAIDAGLTVGPLQNVAVIGPFLTEIPGYEVLECATETNQLATIPKTQTRIAGLSLISQLFHSVASPEVTFLFLAAGLWLLIFELFTAGVGVAGVLGAVLLTLSSYGLGALPTNWWAIGLILVSVFFLGVDIQTNVPRGFTVVGLLVFAAGMWFLFDGISISWVTMVLVLISAVLYAYVGMPNMVRTRFSTPTIGRKWMIGSMGVAEGDIDPEGTVTVNGVAWKAITNRATPIKSGENARVVGLDRLLLEVEPETGAAEDYRERRKKPKDEEASSDDRA